MCNIRVIQHNVRVIASLFPTGGVSVRQAKGQTETTKMQNVSEYPYFREQVPCIVITTGLILGGYFTGNRRQM